mmetsp:Transcript_44284/g.96333  ORF Transcript_44284/g.96333 Transcript_44284/m.96333 type:complete len:203 (-) Transcript_44284:171-779(-)|eukprot:CAMPEP_0204269934 /NCGR_PEP_ID=MMETSP0468-20130131/17695_1 /ASSEMBLY_ACC=CAM_ASM_000383 /TAXON_ID=2969 /ORGANISM="Oxyrrhis marina" /LENGTH=202 /DNA_ID=CAMNT_0051245405 /DNA_START=34 /DNA_END=642 /DNA_ORIENTATION=-
MQLLLCAISVASAAVCPPAGFNTTLTDFDIKQYASAKWFTQQQMPVTYLPTNQNYCVYAEYSVKDKQTLLGYDVGVHNHAEESSGKVHQVDICAKIVDGKAGKLEVSPCFLPTAVAGPYWVLSYNESEGYALVSGGPPTKESNDACKTGSGVNGSGLWIFTRKQQRDEQLLAKVRGIATDLGFDVSVLNDVDQSKCGAAVVV